MSQRWGFGGPFFLALMMGGLGCGSPRGSDGIEAGSISIEPERPWLLRQTANLRAETVHLALSQAYAADVTHFADRIEERESAGEDMVVGRGRCRIIIRALTIECKAFTLRLRPVERGGSGDLLLVATGGVVWKVGHEVTRADTLLADADSVSFEGDFQLDVQRSTGSGSIPR